MLVKCPNCGSSAQIKTETLPRLSDNKQVLTIGFVCGCGCHFDADHERNEAGEWEHNWTSIKWVDADWKYFAKNFAETPNRRTSTKKFSRKYRENLAK